MTGSAKSTITALFYAKQRELDFPTLSAKLASAMLQASEGGLQIHTDYDDFVIFDQADVRICLAHAQLSADFPDVVAAQGCDEGFIVTVGELPDGTGRADHAEICARLAAQIESRFPADGEVVLESDVAVSEDSYDSLLEEIVAAFSPDTGQSAPADAEAEADDVLVLGPDSEIEVMDADEVLILGPESEIEVGTAAKAAQPSHQRRADPFQPIPSDWVPSDLIARYDREIARRNTARSAPRYAASRRRSPGPTVFPAPDAAYVAAGPRTARASAAFGTLRPQPTHGAFAADGAGARTMEKLGIRITGAEPAPDSVFPSPRAAHRAPLVHRSAINALNVAVMAFSLPVGAFLVTLALLGRESLTMSSRVTAVTGAGLGISQSDTAMGFIQSFLS